MNNLKKFLFVLIIFIFSFYITLAEDIIPTDPISILGCLDQNATNYNPSATEDDGSCIYLTPTPNIPDPVPIHLSIKTNTETLYNQNISVTECDSDNAGTLKITAYCAILQSGIQSDWNWDWGSAFLNSLGGIAGFTTKDENNADVYHYWSWSVNGTDGTMSLGEYILQPNDLISLTFIDPTPPPPPEHHHSGGKVEKKIFDTQKALEFLVTEQKENGSFGEELYTDWTSLALSSSPDYQEQKMKLVKYFSENKFTGTLLTDLERHSMALMALNLNPYNLNGENYIQKITKEFDGTQFGDKTKDNDDIFALIVLQNAGFSKDDLTIQKTIDFILAQQKEDGSWDKSVDLTGAGMESLAKFKDIEKVKTALTEALKFLESKKENDHWENVSATAWALQGEIALGHSTTGEALEERISDPLREYLGENQETDGGVKDENIQNKIWKTAYIIPSALDKNWNQIMQNFEQPKEISSLNPILEKRIENLKQTNFLEKVEKFEKINPKTTEINSAPEEKNEQPIKKQNWFRRLIGRIFNL